MKKQRHIKALIVIADAISTLNRWVAYCCAAMIFVMVAIIGFDVFCRYFLDQPTDWAMELSIMLFGPYFLLCGGYLLNQNGHVNVDILHEKMPKRVQKWFDFGVYVIIIVLCALFIVVSLPFAVEAFRNGETSFSTWNPIVWPVKLSIPLALFLLALQALAQCIYHLLTPASEP